MIRGTYLSKPDQRRQDGHSKDIEGVAGHMGYFYGDGGRQNLNNSQEEGLVVCNAEKRGSRARHPFHDLDLGLLTTGRLLLKLWIMYGIILY